MSYSQLPGYGSAQLMGCAALGLGGSLIVAFFLVAAAMGDCGPEADGSGCENGGLIRLLMFPGSLIALIVIGIVAARRVTRDRD